MNLWRILLGAAVIQYIWILVMAITNKVNVLNVYKPHVDKIIFDLYNSTSWPPACPSNATYLGVDTYPCTTHMVVSALVEFHYNNLLAHKIEPSCLFANIIGDNPKYPKLPDFIHLYIDSYYGNELIILWNEHILEIATVYKDIIVNGTTVDSVSFVKEAPRLTQMLTDAFYKGKKEAIRPHLDADWWNAKITCSSEINVPISYSNIPNEIKIFIGGIIGFTMIISVLLTWIFEFVASKIYDKVYTRIRPRQASTQNEHLNDIDYVFCTLVAQVA